MAESLGDLLSLIQEQEYYRAGGSLPGQRDIDKIGGIFDTISKGSQSIIQRRKEKEEMEKTRAETAKLKAQSTPVKTIGEYLGATPRASLVEGDAGLTPKEAAEGRRVLGMKPTFGDIASGSFGPAIPEYLLRLPANDEGARIFNSVMSAIAKEKGEGDDLYYYNPKTEDIKPSILPEEKLTFFPLKSYQVVDAITRNALNSVARGDKKLEDLRKTRDALARKIKDASFGATTADMTRLAGMDKAISYLSGADTAIEGFVKEKQEEFDRDRAGFYTLLDDLSAMNLVREKKILRAKAAAAEFNRKWTELRDPKDLLVGQDFDDDINSRFKK